MTATAASAERPLRRDAERNRELILDAARGAFAEHGLDVGLHEIARRAGVGVGTVYRRFGDKDALVDALFEDRVEDVVGIARAALAEPSAWQGLEDFFVRTLELQAADRGLHEIVFSRPHGPSCAAGARRRVAPLVARLVRSAQAEGTLRPDVGPYDVGMLRKSLGAMLESTHDVDPDAWRRQLRIVLDGLRAERTGPSALPGRPMRPAEFAQAQPR